MHTNAHMCIRTGNNLALAQRIAERHNGAEPEAIFHVFLIIPPPPPLLGKNHSKSNGVFSKTALSGAFRFDWKVERFVSKVVVVVVVVVVVEEKEEGEEEEENGVWAMNVYTIFSSLSMSSGPGI